MGVSHQAAEQHVSDIVLANAREFEEMLADYGFTQTMIIEDNHGHENGPAIALIARQE